MGLEERKAANRKYWRTKNGKLMSTYNNMDRRVRGYIKPHLYKGLDLLPRNVFYEWSLKNESFHCLFVKWVESNYERKLSPSIDRIDSSLGYSLDNMRWITHSENSRLGSINNLKKQKQ